MSDEQTTVAPPCAKCGEPEQRHTGEGLFTHAFVPLLAEAPSVPRTTRPVTADLVHVAQAARAERIAAAILALKEHAPIVGSVHAWLEAAADVVRKGPA